MLHSQILGSFCSQETEAAEEKKRVEMERFRGGAGERDDASPSASATDQKESHDNTSALMMQYSHSNRSDSSPPEDVNAEDVPGPQAPHIDPVRDLNHVFFILFLDST